MVQPYSRPVPEATITVTADSATPIYRQVVAQIRLHIGQGAMSPGQPLPSVRGLAAQLGVHFNTVAAAYRELADEGLIDLAHGKRATILAPGSPPALPRAEAETLRQSLRQLIAEMRLKGISAAIIRHEVSALLER